MKIEITTDFRAYPDGKNERRFKAGEVVDDLPDDVADTYVGKGLASKKDAATSAAPKQA